MRPSWTRTAEELKLVEAPTANSAPPSLTVEAVDNHVYFYSGIDEDRCLALMRHLREIDTRLRAERLTRSLSAEFRVPIWLHINSFGGDVFSAFAAADQIAQLETPVYSIAEGCVASAATLISVACTKRYIQPNAYMLIHQFSSFFWGKHEEFKDEMVLQDMLMERFVSFYKAHTNLSKTQVRKKLKHDFWMDAGQAVDLGFVDDVFGMAPPTGKVKHHG
jgi:ATP-dependent protease ClpP protease subunit